MINHKQLRELIIQPALKAIDCYTPEAEELLISTCAQESQDGLYLKQTVGGDNAALGIYQMQPQTHEDIWNSTDQKFSYVKFAILKACNYALRPKPEVMIYNLWYATMMARVFWYHVKEPMPDMSDFNGRWTLYKKYWNTATGKATKEEFEANYNRYVKG